ncbi:hypothetical protein, partial [Pseudomonas guariconensis]|uniref:hypothetical protein n=1 Tax=Pseudomonas guariconensis TaxID=1288410 RepID=UPI001E34A842
HQTEAQWPESCRIQDSGYWLELSNFWGAVQFLDNAEEPVGAGSPANSPVQQQTIVRAFLDRQDRRREQQQHHRRDTPHHAPPPESKIQRQI